MGFSLFQRLREFGDRPAVVWHHQPLTYRQLADRIDAWRQRLEIAGIAAGSVCAILGDQSVEACAALLALLDRKSVAVPLCSLPPTQHERCFDIAGVVTVIAEASGGWRIRLCSTGPAPELLNQLRSSGVPGLVLFSSGSTGDPKAALWNAERLIRRHRESRRSYRTLVFLRLDHIGGLNTLFHTLCAGGCLIVSAQRDPESVCRAVEQYRVELLPTTPTFLKMLLISRAVERFDLSSLRLVTYGTEPMAAGVLSDLCAALPGVEFKQTYGLSELGILPTKSRQRDSMWLKLGGPGYETRIVDGVLWVRTASAMLGYLNHPSPFDADGWFNTQDAVEVDGEYVRILGRTSEIINVGGEKVYPAEVEAVLTQADNVAAAAVFGKRNAVMGQVVAARVSLLAEEPDAEGRLIAFCRECLAPYQVPMLIEITRGPLHSERGKLIRREGPHGG